MKSTVYEGGGYKVLSEKEISQIHEMSVRVLENVGFEINYPPALELFEKCGARVDYDQKRVYVSRDLVSRYIKQAPEEFAFYGSQQGKGIVVGGKRVHFGSGGLALYVLDLERNKRPGTLKDVADLAKLADKLEYLDFYIVPVYPHDINIDTVDINTKYQAILNTGKPVMGGIFSKHGLDSVVQIASIIAGGNFIHEAFGMLDGAMTVSYAQYVIDNDIVGSCLRTLRGIEVNDDSLAYDVIASVGPGGNYLSEEHTVRYMRTESYSPRASDRQQYQHWLDAGSKDSWKRAEEIAAELINEPPAETISREADQEIRSQFPELENLNSNREKKSRTGS